MVVLRTRVRASSVPAGYIGERVEPIPSYLTEVSQNAAARRISNSARDDTDALLSASKRHDRELLSDINNRLANASFQQPVVVRRSSISLQRNKPPLPPGGSGAGTARGGSSTLTSTVRLLPSHRRIVDDDDDAIAFPKTPVTTSVIRSARANSVPPRLPTTSTLVVGGGYGPSSSGIYLTPVYDGLIVTPRTRVTPPRGYNQYLTKHQLREYVQDHPSYYGVDSKPPPVSSTMTPVADLAIRQAHRNLDRIEREIKSTSADQTNNLPHLSNKSYIEVGYDDYLPVRRTTYRTSGYVPSAPSAYRGTSLRTTSLSPARSTTTTTRPYQRYVSPSPSRDVVYLDGLSPSIMAQLNGSSPASTIEREIKSHYYTPMRSEIIETLMPTEMYRTRATPPTLRSSTTASYVVPTLSSPVARSTFSYGGTTSDVTRRSLPPPVRQTLDNAPIPQPSTGRPKLSETRRKVREVLCKVKNDPHYFD